LGKLRGRHRLEEMGTAGRIILKCKLDKYFVKCELN
jgi:hypothetical protein